MLHGTCKFGYKRVACRNAYCVTCGQPRFAECFRSWLFMHVLFIPILPLGTLKRWFCSFCWHEVEAGRPQRPFVLLAGVITCCVMVFVGVMMLLSGVGRDFSIGFIFIWGALAVTFASMRKKQAFRDYIAAVAQVEPLPKDHCPYCQAPLFAKAIPHCDRCHVDLL